MSRSPWFVIRDAVHGDIYLTREEGRILDCPEMQRLRGIRQLGLAHLVYPSARHSRFEHSIGTLHMAQAMIEAIRRNAHLDPSRCRDVSDDEARVIRAAALVHDVTHIPFGHNIEDQSAILPRHDEPARFERMLGEDTELGSELARQGLRDDVLALLGARDDETPLFLGQMVSDTICSDLMDYLRRDSYFTGLQVGYDARIVGYFRVDPADERLFVDCEKEGLLRDDIVSEVLRMLQARYYFSERVYYHHAKIAAGAMVARAVEAALEEGWLRPEELYGMTDEGLLIALEQRCDHARADVRMLLDRLARRVLYKRVAVFPWASNQSAQARLIDEFFSPRSAATRSAWERALEAEVRERFGRHEHVLFYCPSRKMQLKEVATLVRIPWADTLAPLSDFKDRLPRIADLEQSYLRLWKAYVFTSAVDPEIRKFLQQRVHTGLPYAVDEYRMR
ncbi:MAG: HD domain-containing protein [Planctomycetes bacterium]|nr:HD domain-containing protein [Planctomycetota bacterium]